MNRPFQKYGVLRRSALLLAATCGFIPIASLRAQQSARNGHATAQQAAQSLFVSRCAGCHGLDARGGEHAPNIATTPRLQQMSTQDLERIVRNGVPSAGMPAFGSLLKDDEQAAVVGYLRVLQGKTNTVAVSGDPEAGKGLFFGKGGCSECHMVAGKGGYFGADLTSYAVGRSAEDIQKAIVDPNAGTDPGQKVSTVVTRDGKKYAGLVRNEDNFSIQLQTPDGVFHLFEKTDVASFRYEPRSFMPANYRPVLSASELNNLISYLVQSSQGREAPPRRRGDF